MYVLLISYVAGEQLITPMKAQPSVALATSLPSSTVDRSTGEDNIITDIFNKILCMLLSYQYINSDSGLLFIMCGHCQTIFIDFD